MAGGGHRSPLRRNLPDWNPTLTEACVGGRNGIVARVVRVQVEQVVSLRFNEVI